MTVPRAIAVSRGTADRRAAAIVLRAADRELALRGGWETRPRRDRGHVMRQSAGSPKYRPPGEAMTGSPGADLPTVVGVAYPIGPLTALDAHGTFPID